MNPSMIDPSLPYQEAEVQEMENQLKGARQRLPILFGATLTLLAIGLLTFIVPNPDGEQILPWMFVWLFVQVALWWTGLSLLITAKWRRLSLSVVQETAFQALGIAWIAFLAFPIRFLAAQQPANCAAPQFLLVAVWGFALYSWRSRWQRKAEDLFP